MSFRRNRTAVMSRCRCWRASPPGRDLSSTANSHISSPNQRQPIPIRGVPWRAPFLLHAPLPPLARQPSAGSVQFPTAEALIDRIECLHQPTPTGVRHVVIQRQFLLNQVRRSKIKQHHTCLGIFVSGSINCLQTHECGLVDVPDVIAGPPKRHHR